jgi:hypothetical protein
VGVSGLATDSPGARAACRAPDAVHAWTRPQDPIRIHVAHPLRKRRTHAPLRERRGGPARMAAWTAGAMPPPAPSLPTNPVHFLRSHVPLTHLISLLIDEVLGVLLRQHKRAVRFSRHLNSNRNARVFASSEAAVAHTDVTPAPYRFFCDVDETILVTRS